ncbi:EAL domain-containing protein [Lacticaseibacillus sp. GG6-2]
MFRFFGQPKFDLNPDNQKPIGYELFIREWRDERWVLPEDFNKLSAPIIEKLLTQIVAVVPDNITMLSFNLEQDQFVDPAYMAMVLRIEEHTKLRLFIELTERVAPCVTQAQLVAAAQRYADAGLLVCIDDVGTGQNTPQMVLQMGDSVAEYKFALQNFRPFKTIDDIKDELDYWYDLAKANHKFLAIEGLETDAEFQRIRQDYPCDVVQGYLLGKPALLDV